MTNNKIYLNDFKIENYADDSDFLKIQGYCCHYGNANLNDEIVDNTSFAAFFKLYNDKKLNPSFTYDHSDEVIGGIDSIVSKKDGLYLTARLNKKVKRCNEMIIPNIMAGDLNSLSTEGFPLNYTKSIVENEDGSYFVKDFILTAVSVVRTPADYDAKFSITNYIAECLQNKTDKEIQKDITNSKSKYYLLF